MSAGFPSPGAQRQTSFPKGPQQDIPMDQMNTSSFPSNETYPLFPLSSNNAPKSFPAYFTKPGSLFKQEDYISRIKEEWDSDSINYVEIYYLSSIISQDIMSLVNDEVHQPEMTAVIKPARAGASVQATLNQLIFTAVNAFFSESSSNNLPSVLDEFKSACSNIMPYSNGQSVQKGDISGCFFSSLPTRVKAFLLILVSIYFETPLNSLQDVFKKHNIDLGKESITVNDEKPMMSILGQRDAQFLVNNILKYELHTNYTEVNKIYQICLAKVRS